MNARLTDRDLTDIRPGQFRLRQTGLLRAALVVTALLATACDGDYYRGPDITGPDTIVGSGRLASESRPVGGFHGVNLGGAGRLLVDRNGLETLLVTSDDNILPVLRSEVIGGLLDLGVEPGTSIRSSREILYEVGARQLDEIRVTGAGEVEASGLATGRFRLEVSGAGHVTAFGQAMEQEITITGAGRYDADGVDSRVVTLNVTGAGFARLRVSDRLDATVTGSAVVEYYGNPVLNVTGSGTVRRVGS